MLPQLYCLRWKYHHNNLQTMFSQLLDRGCFCDVTLACEGQVIRAHRVVLSACSTLFDNLLSNYATEKDPIIIMKDAKFFEVKCLIEFMYKGEINIEHCKLTSLLKTAEDLKIKGLAEVSFHREEMNDEPILPPETNLMDEAVNDHIIEEDENVRIETLAQRMPPALTPIPANLVSGHGGLVVSPTHNDSYASQKRKRGRPPMDDSYDTFNISKPTHNENGVLGGEPEDLCLRDDQSGMSMSSLNHESQQRTRSDEDIFEDQQDHCKENGNGMIDMQNDQWVSENVEVNTEPDQQVDIKPNISILEGMEFVQHPLPSEQTQEIDSLYSSNETESNPPPVVSIPPQPSRPSYSMEISPQMAKDLENLKLNPEELEHFKNVVKMDTYLAKGRRPQFWEEPFTKKILDLIKNKKLEMKKAAKLLGVSYGTLYGRYREVYGCLKHPYRGNMNERYSMSSTSGPSSSSAIWPPKHNSNYHHTRDFRKYLKKIKYKNILLSEAKNSASAAATAAAYSKDPQNVWMR
ncbi:hypothetical protein ACFFRR_002113 [Megaselia abdita]